MLTALTGIDRHESIFAALEEAPAKGGIAGFDHRKADISSGVKIIEDPTPTAKRTPRAFFFRPALLLWDLDNPASERHSRYKFPRRTKTCDDLGGWSFFHVEFRRRGFG